MRLLSVASTFLLLASSTHAQLGWTRGAGSWPLPAEAGSAFDEERNQLVVFGGDQSFQALDITWIWDGSRWTRQILNPSPSPRIRPAMVWDPQRRAIVLFGGFDGNGGFLNDLWSFDGRTWSRIQTSGAAPTLCSGAAIAYDRDRQQLVLHGGFVSPTRTHGETWVLDRNTWRQATPASAPSARAAHRMVWHPETGEIVLHGGVDPQRARTLGDTWTWDGRNWVDRTGAGVGPGSLCDQLLVWDAARRRITHWGGLRIAGQTETALGDLLDFDGRNWIRRTPTGGGPGPRAFPHGAFDPRSGAIEVGAGASPATRFTDWWRLAPTSPARILPVGRGCVGTNGIPGIEHDAGQLPWLDSTFDVWITNLPASGPVAINIGLSKTIWPGGPLPFDLTPLGITGCSLLTSIELAVGATRQGGVARFTGSVCDCPAALGASFYLQAVVADPGVNRPVTVSLSDAVEGVVGAR